MTQPVRNTGSGTPPLQAVCFLDALGGEGASFTFQTFSDGPEKKGALAQVWHGTLAELWPQLKQLNERRAGIFVTVNQTDLKGRKAKNVQAVRALFVDLDGSPLQPVLDGPLAPSLIIESSPERWHAYWLVRDCPLDDFKHCQQLLAAKFAGDKAVNDLPRVMRLPGFLHQKHEAFTTRIEAMNDITPYPYAQLVKSFALDANPEPVAHAAPASPPPAPRTREGDDVADDLRDALRALNADDYKTWIDMGHALKTLGSEGFSLWSEWSASSGKFNALDAAKRWEGFSPEKTQYQSVFAEAKRSGWDPARAPSIARKRQERELRAARNAPPARDADDPGPEPDPPRDDKNRSENQPAPPADAAPIELTEKALIERFELVHGKTDVWDCSTGEAMKWAAFLALVGKELATSWKASPSKRNRIVPQDKKPAKAKRGKATDPTILDRLNQRYALIYGTEAVFDFDYRMELTLGSLRAFAGLKAVRDWTDHPKRRVVRLEEVAFDPSRDPEDKEICNLWAGWPHLPVEGRGEDAELLTRWKAVLHYLCGESDAVFDWVMKWFAYPLQHPGAKMRSSVIFHGPEGSGKNTIGDAVRRIYGKYGTSITQVQLESQWTDWISAKLFVVGNEVLHRQEQITQKGRLKSLISEPTVPVDRKFLPGRVEPNYANMVFLSNELMPLNLDFKDRRFLVIWTPPPHPDGKAFYQGLSETEMPISTVQALYHDLLHYDLEDFGPHTKPPMTQAKEELIEASMPGHERFVRAWMQPEKDRVLEVPFIPCKTAQLYQAYLQWCRENGERFPRPENAFAAFTAKLVPRAPGPKRYIEGTGEKQARCYLPPYPASVDARKSESVRLGECIEKFQKALNQWKNPE